MQYAFLLALSGSTSSLLVAFIGLAGASLGAVTLIYTSKKKGESPPRAASPPSDISIGAYQVYDQFRELSHRMDRSDDRTERLEHQLDRVDGRLDRFNIILSNRHADTDED